MKRRVAALAELADRDPELLAVLEQTAARVARLRRDYRVLHWGQRGSLPPALGRVPDVSEGVTVLGHLSEITYLTAKGGRELVLYEHEFTRPLPVLAVAKDGPRRGLVVLRGQSRYTVNVRGIVG